MNKTMQPTESNGSLWKALLLATVVAAATLLTLILPAEFGIDPTGLGSQLGLTRLADASASLEESADESGMRRGAGQFQTFELSLPPASETEIKFVMNQHAKLIYDWQTDGAALYLDLHGEPEGDTSGYFESYTIATAASMQGSFTTPYAGTHG